MDEPQDTPGLLETRVPLSTKVAYALGHIFNDLTAAMWFSYTLIYLERVMLLEPISAGALLLLGQVVDAFMTPVFGVLVDRYIKKKIWHIIGSVMVTLTFPIVFGALVDLNSTAMMVFYILCITVFQTGWAAVQISHLSMIPTLAKSLHARSDLTAVRYSAQVIAAVVVFIITWIVLPTNEASIVRLTEQDDYKFRNIVVILTSIGLAATVFFHIFLKDHLLEISPSKANPEEATRLIDNSGLPLNNRRSWFSMTILLRVALLYVASRLFMILATVYLPLYIEETKVGGKEALATVPLVSYLSSFTAALLLKYIHQCFGAQVCYLLGAVLGIVSALITEYAGSNAAVVYTVAILIGTGSSITMVTSLSVTAELIGPRTERSAFVYSIVTFLDKVITGIVVMIIEKWRCEDKLLCPNFNKDTLAIVCATSMILGLFALLSVSRCLPSR